MICNICGEPRPCAHTGSANRVVAQTELRRDLRVNATGQTAIAGPAVQSEDQALSLDELAAQVRARSDQRHWREEVSLRVNRHRARRQRSGDEASLRLDFPEGEALVVNSGPTVRRRQGLPPSIAQAASAGDEESVREQTPVKVRQQPRKIIRFPKYAIEDVRPTAPRITAIELAEAVNELAEPVIENAQFMEARPAEQLELLPSFAEIRLDESPRENSLAGDPPLRPASLGIRVYSALVDLSLVLLSLAVFVFSFSSMTPAGTVPARTQLLSTVVIGVALWLLFQYVFLVYGNATPGMRIAQLNLVGFEGERASFFARRSRALASALSALSVGLGFAWALVDEDTLGWHDRISRTYLKGN